MIPRFFVPLRSVMLQGAEDHGVADRRECIGAAALLYSDLNIKSYGGRLCRLFLLCFVAACKAVILRFRRGGVYL